MSLVRSLALIGVIIAAGSCSILDSHDSTSELPSDIPLEGVAAYFPVRAGNTWVYEVLEDDEVIGRDTVSVIKVEDRTATLVDPTGNVSYGVGDDAIIIVAYDDIWSLEPDPLILGPITVGTSWQSCFAGHEIANTDTTIATPYGTFTNVLDVRSVSCAGYCPIGCIDATVTHTYYAPGIGLIMMRSTTVEFPNRERRLISLSHE